MGIFETMMMEFERTPSFLKGDMVAIIVGKFEKLINVSLTFNGKDKINSLIYLYGQCFDVAEAIAKSMGYELDYVPYEDEFWDAVNNGIIEKYIEGDKLKDYIEYINTKPKYIDESRLYDFVIEPMTKLYRDKHKEASKLCDRIEDVKNKIGEIIDDEREKELFLNEVNADHTDPILSKIGIISSEAKQYDKIDQYLQLCNVENVKNKLETLNLRNLVKTNYKAFACIIHALFELNFAERNAERWVGIFGGGKKEYSSIKKYVNRLGKIKLDLDKNKSNYEDTKQYEKVTEIINYLKE